MKPILEWYKEYPDEKIRQELIENYDPEYRPECKQTNALSDAIWYGFGWSETPQDYEYWDKIYRKQEVLEDQPTPIGGLTDEMCITHLKNNGYKIFKEL